MDPTDAWRSILRRIGLPAVLVAVVAFCAAPAAPAAAADPAARFSVSVPTMTGMPVSVLAAAGSPGKDIQAWFTGRNVRKPKVVFDVSGLAGVASLTLPAKLCSGLVCTLPDGDFHLRLPIHLTGTTAAPAEGSFGMTLSGDNVATESVPQSVTLYNGADLVILQPLDGDDLGTVRPGQTVHTRLSITNAGNAVVHGFTMTMTSFADIRPVGYVGCDRVDNRQMPGIEIRCSSPMDVKPGQVLSFYPGDGWREGPPGANAAVASTIGPTAIDTIVVDFELASGDYAPTTASPAELDWLDNHARTSYTAVSTYDLAGIGATASGKVGDTIKINIGIRNNGPATLFGEFSAVRWVFTVPPGVEVTAVGPMDRCGTIPNADYPTKPNTYRPNEPGGRFYLCSAGDTVPGFPAGDTEVVVFTLKVTQLIPNATGSVLAVHRTYPPGPIVDAKPANDKGLVIINPTASGSGGGLPITGTQVDLVGGLGGLAVLAGGITYLVARRRRVVLTVPSDELSPDNTA